MAEQDLNPSALTPDYNPNRHAGLSVQVAPFFIPSQALAHSKCFMTPYVPEKTELQVRK